VDVNGEEVESYPQIAQAIEEGRPAPFVVSGDTVKSPPVLSFAWVVNELKELGVIE